MYLEKSAKFYAALLRNLELCRNTDAKQLHSVLVSPRHRSPHSSREARWPSAVGAVVIPPRAQGAWNILAQGFHRRRKGDKVVRDSRG